MTWVRRQQPEHTCKPPTAEGRGPVPQPPGAIGDLWRCDDCQKLWRIADMNESVHGHHIIDMKTWEPATLRQRIRYYWTPGEIYPDDIWPPPSKGPMPPPPPRQTGTDWLYTEREDGKTR